VTLDEARAACPPCPYGCGDARRVRPCANHLRCSIKGHGCFVTTGGAKRCKPSVVERYQGKRAPRCGCSACWSKFLRVNFYSAVLP